MKTGMALAAALGLPALAIAGPEASPIETPASNSGDWCSWLQSKPGQFKFEGNPLIQSFQIGGRFQYQAAYIDGNDARGNDFNDTYDEYRRVRIETKTDFLQYFTAKVGINIVGDARNRAPAGGDLDWGYQDFDEAYVNFNIKKAFDSIPLDTLDIQYGRHKFNMSEEVHMSSKEIYTLERSAIANKLYGSPNRATGVTLNGSLGAWSATLGVFSGEDDSELIGGWNDGQVYYLSVGFKQSDTFRYVLDFAQNDQSGADDYLGYGWATAFNVIYDDGTYGFLGTAVLGENNEAGLRGGSFNGFVAMPWYWIMEDKLQAVFQYQYSGSERSNGIRTNSRYVRANHGPVVNPNMNGGRGDELHTFYAGLNYLICGDNAKIMAGIEYASLNTPIGDVDAFTYSMAFRMFF